MATPSLVQPHRVLALEVRYLESQPFSNPWLSSHVAECIRAAHSCVSRA